MVLVASAPAPLTATPIPRAPATASAAAAEVALMVALSVDFTEMPPALVVTPWLTLAMYACTVLSILFVASASPMETAKPLLPKDAASDAAAAVAVIVDVSLAL